MKKLLLAATLLNASTLFAGIDYFVPGESFELKCKSTYAPCYGMPSVEELKSEVSKFKTLRSQNLEIISQKMDRLADYADQIEAKIEASDRGSNFEKLYAASAAKLMEKRDRKEELYSDIYFHLSEKSPFLTYAERIIERHEHFQQAAGEVSSEEVRKFLGNTPERETAILGDDYNLMVAIKAQKQIKKDFVDSDAFIDGVYKNGFSSFHGFYNSFAPVGDASSYISLEESCKATAIMESLDGIAVNKSRHSLGLLDDAQTLRKIVDGPKANGESLKVSCSKFYGKGVSFNAQTNQLKLGIYKEKRFTGMYRTGWFSDEAKPVYSYKKMFGLGNFPLETIQELRDLYGN